MMTKSDIQRLQLYLSECLGLPFLVSSRPSSEGEVVEIVPVDLHPSEGFRAEVLLAWRSARGELIPGRFAKDFVHEMGRASDAAKECFQALAERLMFRRLNVDLIVNGLSISPTDWALWPDEWQSVKITVLSRPFDPSAGPQARFQEMRVVAEAVIALVLSLATESDDSSDVITSEAALEGYPEGAVANVRVNRYERDPRNRGLCIAAYGTECRVCGFDFERSYGQLGSGFIHVHHIRPLSMSATGYIVNPVRDLVPLCPNCHSMVHRQHPPLLPDQLRAILKDL